MQRLYSYLQCIAATLCIIFAFAPSSQANLVFIRDAEIERTLYTLSDPIFEVAGVKDRVDLYIIQNPKINAFVAGGSNIFLHTGLIQELEEPEELIGVIAHETGHITGGHLARRGIAIRQAQGPAMMGLLLGLAAGIVTNSADVGLAAVTGGQQVLQRSLLRHSRSEEASADQAALTYMLKAGIDPEGLITTLERFQGQDVFSPVTRDPYALTHPLSYERIVSLRQKILETATQSRPLAPELIYLHKRMRAKFRGFLDKPRDILRDIPASTQDEIALYTRTIALHRLPDPEAATEAVMRLLKIKPDDPFYHELHGQILLESGRGAAAIAPYKMAVKLAPQEPLLLSGLGRALLSTDTQENNAKALMHLEKAARQDNQDAGIRRYLAIAYARNGNEGMAALATAERFAIGQNITAAQRHAHHAVRMLKEGTTGWLRAQDILAIPSPDDES